MFCLHCVRKYLLAQRGLVEVKCCRCGRAVIARKQNELLTNVCERCLYNERRWKSNRWSR
jgi:hypothetical protein